MLSAGIRTVDSSKLCSRMGIGKGGYAPAGTPHGCPDETQDIATMPAHCKHGLMKWRRELVGSTGDRSKLSPAKAQKRYRRNAIGLAPDQETFRVVLIIQAEPKAFLNKRVYE